MYARMYAISKYVYEDCVLYACISLCFSAVKCCKLNDLRVPLSLISGFSEDYSTTVSISSVTPATHV